MESVTLPPGLKTIEDETFRLCESLKNVVFRSALEKIGIYTFYKAGIESLMFPASIRQISQGAFAECEHLKSVELGEGLEELGANEYFNGTGLYGVF